MKKQSVLRVSNSASGMNIYMTKELASSLPVAPYAVEIVRDGDAGPLTVRLFPHEGSNRISSVSRSGLDYQYRLTVSELRLTGLKRSEVPLFGVYEAEWMHLTNSRACLCFKIPPQEQLPAPQKRRVRSSAGESGRQLHLELRGAAEETPHARLGRVLRELNQILASGTVDDVVLTASRLGNGDISRHQLGTPSELEIKGRVVREEIIG